MRIAQIHVCIAYLFLVVYVMSFPRANIGRWWKGRGENIAIFLTLISTSHVEQLCSSLS